MNPTKKEEKHMSKRIAAVALALCLLHPVAARAHCDTLDGPVVVAARQALETGKVNPVLAWVRPQDEKEIRAAFARARAVRQPGGEARELADTWFFETLVRVHRDGEGAPFTGLQPAGLDLGPAVPAADRALATGSPETVEKLLVAAVRAGLHERFEAVKARELPGDDVAAGRAWVAAYVPFVHWVEGVFEAAQAGAWSHAEHAGETHAHDAPAHGHPVGH